MLRTEESSMPTRPAFRVARVTVLLWFIGLIPSIAAADRLSELLEAMPAATAVRVAPPVEVLGAAPAGHQVDALTSSPIATFESNVAGRRLGTSVAVAGDVNGDGFSDLVALGVQFNGPTSFYLFLGGPAGPTLAPGFPYLGLPAFSSVVAGVGDLDGNGLADVAVGSPNSTSGSVRVFYGRNGGLDMANPFILNEPVTHTFGTVVAPAGDLNADGVDDMVVGSPFAENLGFYCGIGVSGQVDVYFGANGTGISASSHWFVNGCFTTGNDSEFGAAVGTAGDANGDGIDDLVIGAPAARRTMTPFNQAGRVFVLPGSASGLPMHPTIPNLGTLAGATVLEAYQDGSRFGAAAITAGDVNGDGFADLAVGAPLEDNVGGRDLGAVRVFAGSSSGIQSGTLLYQGTGSPAFSRLGTRLAPAGDSNGDGRADLMVGEQARVYVVPSVGSSLGYTGINFPSSSEFGFCTAGDMTGDGLSDIAVGDPDFTGGELGEGRVRVFAGRGDGPALAPIWSFSTNLTEAALGWSVAPAGDVNGDGFEDFLTGAVTMPNIAVPGENINGGVFLNYGGINGPTAGFSDWSFVGLPNDELGAAVASAGDINGDGFGDFMAGATQTGFGPGKVRIWFGKSAHLAPGSAPDVTLVGPDAHSQFGFALTAGDFNGDGYSDIAVGAPNADLLGPTVSETGKVYVYLGGPAGLDAVADFIRSGSFAFDHLGSSLAAEGDVNGDGYCDLIIGVPDANDAASDGGRAEVWIGQSTGPPLNTGTSRFGTTAGIHFGQHVAYAGDINGDGRSDVIVGMPSANSNTGKVMVHTGAPNGTWISFAPFWTQDGFQPGSQFGSAVSSAGDVDGDGLSDVLIGSEFETTSGSENGGARVFLGPLPAGAPPKWFTSCLVDGAHFGHALANAGDVNGDGWSDLLFGAPAYSSSMFHQGLANLYFGGYGLGRLAFTLPQRASGAKIALRGLADAGSFRLANIAVSAAGRTKLKTQWKTQLPPFFPASVTPAIGTQSFFTPTGTPGALGSAAILFPTIDGLAHGGPYAWQMRTLSRSVYFPTTRWISPVRNGGKEYDLRSPGTWLAVGDEPEAGSAALAAPWPNPMTSRSTVAFDLARAGDVSLEVLDLQGRRVRMLMSGARAAGPHQATWDGRDESGHAVGAGVYFYRLTAGGEARTQRVVRIP